MIPIEYIGPAPHQKRKGPAQGTWYALVLVCLITTYFTWPTVSALLSKEIGSPTESKLFVTVNELRNSSQYGDLVAAAALERTAANTIYDGSVYNNIGYPGGDIPSDRGTNSDLIIRAYRSLNTDLQLLIFEDMTQHFYLYPQLWGQRGPDTNIDHRRVQNLQRFFERHAITLENSRNPDDYKNGDIVVWRLPSGKSHIGIVTPGPGPLSKEKWVVHNHSTNPSGPQWRDELLNYSIIGHFRYDDTTVEAADSLEAQEIIE